MILIDDIWISTEPFDMRASPDSCLARVLLVFGEARPHHGYIFSNKRGNRIKVLVHDGFGIWLAARHLHQGKLTWAKVWQGERVELNIEQLIAFVIDLPWHQVGENNSISVL
ncbi:MAG: IS66 family insertion sequence element accessory protein TnpB [Pseudomonadales bacterium]|nr:IS66 family insertion sequence element accessory protein TnpB [Pseudomonadales bacterium]